MFSNKRKDIPRITNKPPPRDFRAEFNQVISQIHAKRTASHDEFGGRLNRLEGPRDMEVVCVKNSLKRNDTPAGMGFHFGSILGYSTEQVQERQHRIEIGEGRSDFAEMKRKLELNLNQSCRFKQHANISSALKDTCASEMIMSGSDDHDDSDSARGRSASSSGSCHSANESISGSEVDEADSPQDPDEQMLDKFANECKISLSTAPMKPTVIHIDTPLKENFRDEEFIEANNEILAVDKPPKPSDNVYEDVVLESGGATSSADSSIEASAVSAWLAKRGVVLEDCDAPRIVSVSRVEEKDDQIKVVKRRFLKHDPKRRRADNVTSVSTDSQYSSDESTDAVKSSEASVCSEFSESRATVILGEVDTEVEVKGERAAPSGTTQQAPRTDQRISASSEKEERSETVDLKSDFDVLSNAPKASSVVVVSRPKKSFKAIRAQYDRHMAVEDDLIEVLPSVRRLAHMFRFEGDPSDLKNKYHSLTGRSLSKEFRQKQLRPKPSLPRSARFDEALPMERPRTQLQKISELSEIHEVPQPEAKPPAKSQKKIPALRSGSATVSGAGGPAESKKKKSRSKAASCKGFFDREILARLSKFQQFI